MMRTFAEFTSSLPTEQIEDETDFIQLGGRPVTIAVNEVFAGLGCDVRPVESADYRGWDFRFRYRKLRLWCQISLIESGDHRDFVELMDKFGDALAADPWSHDVGWFHEREKLTERLGADRPGGAFRDHPCIRRQVVEDQPF